MALEFEKGLDVADVYAAALLALARAAGQLDPVRAELEALARLEAQDPAFAAFLRSAAVDDDARARSLERMFRGRLSDLVLDTLQVMNRHGRLDLLRALRRAYELRLHDARGQIEVVATSAVELGPPQRAAVEQVAADLSGRRPLVTYVVDPGVLGGLMLELGDYRLDNTVRRHLRAARAQLRERGSRGLDRGGAD